MSTLYGYQCYFGQREIDGVFTVVLIAEVPGRAVRFSFQAREIQHAALACRCCFRQWLAYAGLPIFE